MAQQKTTGASSIDAGEVRRFDEIGEAWWSPDGPMAALHRLNPLRVAFLRDELVRRLRPALAGEGRAALRPLAGLRLLDAGCGAGLLAEPLARLGAGVTAIDPAARNIEIARAHAEAGGLDIDYRCTTIEALAATGAQFDAVLALEVLEHVRDVAGFLRAGAALTRPGGLVAAATLNRTFKSYALAIVGAEYVLGWAPRGTHDWRRFITPEELAKALDKAGLRVVEETGVMFDPWRREWRLSEDKDVNYMAIAAKRA